MTGHLKEGLLVMVEAAGRAASEADTYQVFRRPALTYLPAYSHRACCHIFCHRTVEACEMAYLRAVEAAEAHSNYPRRVPPARFRYITSRNGA